MTINENVSGFDYFDNKISAGVSNIKTPAYITSEELLIRNLEILKSVAEAAGCKILLAQKAFSQYSLYPLIGRFLAGTTASGLYEAKLGKEEMGGEVHVFAPAYTDEDFAVLSEICDHIIFNSFSEWQRHKPQNPAKASFGIRVNPECSTQDGDSLYDPCAPFSRLGVTRRNFRTDLLDGIEGLHFHTLCEQNAAPFEKTLNAFIDKFGEFLPRMKWVNFGGGHHITREDYDCELLINVIKGFKNRFNTEVYLEPGEAVALNAGFLISSVLDIVDNGMETAILDTSAACHMPDVLEVPYTPKIIGAFPKGRTPYTYRLGGNTCLAGDVIGDYSFSEPLKKGDKLIFRDMAIYSMVKNNTFNGIPLPDIGVMKKNGEIIITKKFFYEDFKGRL